MDGFSSPRLVPLAGQLRTYRSCGTDGGRDGASTAPPLLAKTIRARVTDRGVARPHRSVPPSPARFPFHFCSPSGHAKHKRRTQLPRLSATYTCGRRGASRRAAHPRPSRANHEGPAGGVPGRRAGAAAGVVARRRRRQRRSRAVVVVGRPRGEAPAEGGRVQVVRRGGKGQGVHPQGLPMDQGPLHRPRAPLLSTDPTAETYVRRPASGEVLPRRRDVNLFVTVRPSFFCCKFKGWC